MKWGGKQRVKWAWIPQECSQCEQWVWLEKYYKESSIHRYCLACDVARELDKQAAQKAYQDLFVQAPPAIAYPWQVTKISSTTNP